MSEKNMILNEAYNALLVTGAAVGISMASKKVLGEKLTDANSLKDTFKLAIAVTAGSLAVQYAHQKNWVPEKPFK